MKIRFQKGVWLWLGFLSFCCVSLSYADGSVSSSRFYHVSKPGLVLEAWHPLSQHDGEKGLLLPVYRHLVASVLDTQRDDTDRSHRARRQVYLQIGPVFSHDSDRGFGGYTALGTTVSLESSRRVRRNWCIPYLGAEVGVISLQTDATVQTGFVGSVLAGLHVWSTPGTSLSVGTGWNYGTLSEISNSIRGTIALEFFLP
jgi:hypothetical protein